MHGVGDAHRVVEHHGVESVEVVISEGLGHRRGVFGFRSAS